MSHHGRLIYSLQLSKEAYTVFCCVADQSPQLHRTHNRLWWLEHAPQQNAANTTTADMHGSTHAELCCLPIGHQQLGQSPASPTVPAPRKRHTQCARLAAQLLSTTSIKHALACQNIDIRTKTRCNRPFSSQPGHTNITSAHTLLSPAVTI